MAQMRAELNSLKAVAQVLSQPVPQSKPVVSTTRRKALLSLAGGLVGGLGMVGIATALPPRLKSPQKSGVSGQLSPLLAMPPLTTYLLVGPTNMGWWL